MEINGLKIIAPEGMEYYIENDEVKFRPISKKLTYDDIAKELFNDKYTYSFCSNGEIINTYRYFAYVDNCTSEKQAKKLLAINQLMNVAKYLNKDWEPNWKNDKEYKYWIGVKECYNKELYIEHSSSYAFGIVYFKSAELTQQAIDILGEETIRLALCTDY